jgi:glutamate racemase
MIGVFDSGIGGLSVLRALRIARPDAPVMYVADTAYAPYGGREEAYLLDRSRRITQWLADRGATSIVVACNTATATAIDVLREQFPAIDFVGVEPGLKPAASTSRNGRIGVLATQATLRSARYARLKLQIVEAATGIKPEFIDQGCPGLADAIENRSDDLPALLAKYCAPLIAAGADTVVLGCTHYPLVHDEIRATVGNQVHIVDTSDAVARRAASRHPRMEPEARLGALELLTSGSTDALTDAARIWIHRDCAPATHLTA